MRLKIEQYGAKEQPCLLIAHGLFGSGRNWKAIATRLSKRFRVLTVDMRNHGNSPFAPEMTYAAMADDLREIVEAEGPLSLLGHSMGGKTSMVLALTAPAGIERLIVGDIAPVAYGHTQTPLIDAMAAVDLSAVTRRSDADRQLAERVEDRAIRAFLIQSLAIEDGVARWRLNLPVLRTHMPEIIGFPDLSGTFEGPTLFAVGAASDYMTAEGRERAKALFPRHRVVSLKGAGHWLHADQPEAFAATVAAFLSA